MRLLPALLLVILLPATSAAGAIYRHVDARGNVVFTDQPPEEGAEEVVLPKLNQVPGERPDEQKTAAPPAFAGYKSLTITGLEDGAVLRDPTVPVSVNVVPQPALRDGDRIVVRHNGEVVDSAGFYQIPAIERGTHTFGAEIVDADGKVMITASDVTIHVFRTMVHNQHAH